MAIRPYKEEKHHDFCHNQGIKFSSISKFIPGSFQILERTFTRKKNTMIFVGTKELNSQIIPNFSMKAFKSWSQLLPGAKAAEFCHNQGIKFSSISTFIPGSFQILESTFTRKKNTMIFVRTKQLQSFSE
ncbi:MAG: hypothetical protein F6K17_14080 [Okeania sp. SIO3C4]|nr:hypothetical protein [Okeania sp. SIO3C4]